MEFINKALEILKSAQVDMWMVFILMCVEFFLGKTELVKPGSTIEVVLVGIKKVIDFVKGLIGQKPAAQLASMQWISAIIAIFKAIPVLDSWFRELILAYTNQKFDKEFTKAWLALIAEKDQRLIEEVLNMQPGLPDDKTDLITRPRTPK